MAEKRVCLILGSLVDLKKHVEEVLPGVNAEGISGFRPPSLTPDDYGDETLDILKEAEVLLCNQPALLWCLQNNATPKLKWCHLMSAGVDRVMRGLDYKKPRPDLHLTRTWSSSAALMAEYVIGQIIARERNIIGMAAKQQQNEWAKMELRKVRPLSKLSIGLLGYGAIGEKVGRVCKFMGMTVWAVTRTRRTSPSPDVDNFRLSSDLPEVLSNCDYICSSLPSTPATKDLLSGDVLKHCSARKTVLINIGRGSVISDDSLVRAIKEEWLGGAILDVFNTEPLPADSPLWKLPNVLISPHVSGPSQSTKIAEDFATNYRLYEAGQPLRCEADWDRGY